MENVLTSEPFSLALTGFKLESVRCPFPPLWRSCNKTPVGKRHRVSSKSLLESYSTPLEPLRFLGSNASAFNASHSGGNGLPVSPPYFFSISLVSFTFKWPYEGNACILNLGIAEYLVQLSAIPEGQRVHHRYTQ